MNFLRILGIRWYLFASVAEEADGVEYLGLILHHSNNIIDRWSVMATIELRLLSVDSDLFGDVVVRKKDHVFEKPGEFIGYGWNKFISVDKLCTGSYIQNDTIQIRIHLSTKNFERIAEF